MEDSYEDIVRKWYVRLKPMFINKLAFQYPSMTLAGAEDLYQDAFIAVHDNLNRGTVRENTAWQTYIITIGLNLASKRIRTINREKPISYFESEKDENGDSVISRIDAILNDLSEDKTPLYKREDAKAELDNELIRMPEPCASIIRLFYYADLSMEEIADEIGYKNASTAKAKKSQCLKEFRKRVHKLFQTLGLTE